MNTQKNVVIVFGIVILLVVLVVGSYFLWKSLEVECTADKDCDDGNVCSAEKCLTITSDCGGTCDPDTEACVSTECVPRSDKDVNVTGDNTDGGASGGGSGTECTYDADCAATEDCIHGVCVTKIDTGGGTGGISDADAVDGDPASRIKNGDVITITNNNAAEVLGIDMLNDQDRPDSQNLVLIQTDSTTWPACATASVPCWYWMVVKWGVTGVVKDTGLEIARGDKIMLINLLHSKSNTGNYFITHGVAGLERKCSSAQTGAAIPCGAFIATPVDDALSYMETGRNVRFRQYGSTHSGYYIARDTDLNNPDSGMDATTSNIGGNETNDRTVWAVDRITDTNANNIASNIMNNLHATPMR
jgi:hypothetical protein